MGVARGQLSAEYLLIAIAVVAFAVIVISIANARVVSPVKNSTDITANTTGCYLKDIQCNRTCVDDCSGTTRRYNNTCSCGTCAHQQTTVCASSCTFGVCS